MPYYEYPDFDQKTKTFHKSCHKPVYDVISKYICNYSKETSKHHKAIIDDLRQLYVSLIYSEKLPSKDYNMLIEQAKSAEAI